MPYTKETRKLIKHIAFPFALDDYKRLRNQAVKEKTTMTELVRRCLRPYLDQLKEKQ